MRIGSLFSGYGGLEEGVRSVLGGTVAWHSEIDPGACKILAHRYPDVPNLGDITAVDWAAVEPVDVLTGGFPCQDVSAAGKRRGLNSETRSGLWAQMARAIDELRPPLVVAENVRGLLSACALSELEPCPRCLGDESQPHRPVLRALGRVLGDLAELGYDARWGGLRAADVGAPHGRFRVFVVAWQSGADPAELGRWPSRRDDRVWAARLVTEPAHADLAGLEGQQPARGRLLSDRSAHADPANDGRERGWHARDGRPGPANGRGGTTAQAQGDGRHEGRSEPARIVGGSDASLGGDAATDADGDPVRQQPVRELGLGGAPVAGHDGECRSATAHPDRNGCEVVERLQPRLGTRRHAHRRRPVDWGEYAPAVHRWERVLGRVAPSPTEPGGSGMGRIRQFAHEQCVDGYTAQEMLRAGRWGGRLSPRFVEWLMGLPAGWVTDAPGITRNEALKALGNGVVPQQAAAALRLLLPDVARWAA